MQLIAVGFKLESKILSAAARDQHLSQELQRLLQLAEVFRPLVLYDSFNFSALGPARSAAAGCGSCGYYGYYGKTAS